MDGWDSIIIFIITMCTIFIVPHIVILLETHQFHHRQIKARMLGFLASLSLPGGRRLSMEPLLFNRSGIIVDININNRINNITIGIILITIIIITNILIITTRRQLPGFSKYFHQLAESPDENTRNPW